MKKFTSLFKVAIVFALAFLASVNVNAQVSSYTFAQSSGTYTEITGGTLLATQTGATGATSLDDVIYNLPSSTIPFTFTYNGTGYTGLNISTNGFITFGATAPVTNYLTPISGTTGYAGAISPFGRDMQGGFIFTATRTSGSPTLTVVTTTAGLTIGQVVSGTGIPVGATITGIGAGTVTLSANATATGTLTTMTAWTAAIRYETIGTTPNREFVIQFKGFKRYTTTLAQHHGMIVNAQIRLKETSNEISIVYGLVSPGVITTDATPQIGLRGSSNTDYNNRQVSASETWATSINGTANSNTCRFISSAPATVVSSGQTYTWSPPSCGTPVVIAPTAVTTNTVTLNWNTASPVPSGGYEYVISTTNTTPSNAANTGTDAAGTSVTNVAVSASTTYYVFVRSDCGSSTYSSWSSSYSFTTPCAPISSFPWTEGFESIVTVGTTAFPACWYEENGDWRSSNAATHTQHDARSGNNYITDAWTATNEFIWTPGFSLTSGTTYYFDFWFVGDGVAGWTGDVFYDTDQTGAGATQLGASFITSTTTSVATYQQVVRSFTPSSTGVYYFAVRVNATSSPYYLGFDDFGLSDTPPCVAPVVTAPTAVTGTTVTLNWNAASPVPSGGYEYVISTTNTTPSNAANTGTDAAGNSVTNVAVSAQTTYYVFVRSDCGSGTYSSWSSSYSFTTPCNATNIPYTQDFESATVPAFPVCTSVLQAGTGNLWVTANNPGSGFTDKTLRYSYNSSNAANTWFYTQGLNLVSGTSYRITFRYGASNASGEKLKVMYGSSADVAGMTNALLDYPTVTQITPQNATYDFTPSSSGVFYVGFQAYSIANQWSLFVDDIVVDLTPSCPYPTALTVTPQSSTTASVSWTGAGNYIVEYGAVGFTPGAAGVAGVGGTVASSTATTPYTLTLPSATTTYDVYVRQVCSGPSYSANTGPVKFIPGDACANAINLASLTSPFVGTTVGAANNSTTVGACYVNSAPELFFSLSVPDGASLSIGQTAAGYDAYTYIFYGGVCPGSTQIACYDPNTQNNTWNNTTGSTQTVYLVQDGWSSNSGTFTLQWSLALCGAQPSALTTNTVTSTTATVSWTAASPNPGNYDVHYSTSNAAPGATPSPLIDVAGLTTNFSGLTPNTQYYYWVRTDCGGGEVSAWVGPQPFFTGYCPPAPTSVDGTGITNVTFGLNNVVNNTTGAEANNYGNYSAMSGDGQQGTVLPVAITFSAGATYGTRIWVDWNDDLDFDDTDEMAYSGTSLATNPTTLSASVTIPLTATIGNHRMRIGGADFGLTAAQYCYTGTWGTFEDYTLEVIAAPACLAPTIVASTNILATTATLNWTAPGTPPSGGYQWEVRSDLLPGTGGATASGSAGAGVLTANATGLTINTSYNIYVRSFCGGSSYSSWVGPYILVTNNDDCGGAYAFPTIPANGTCATVTVNNAGMTQSLAGCSGTADDDQWYTFVVPVGNTSINYSTTNISGSSDRMFQLFDACGGTSLFCNDPESGTWTGLVAGNTYVLRVYSYSNASATSFDLCLSVPPPPPVNDECAAAIAFPVIPLNGNCATVTVNTTSATQSLAACTGTGANDDVWFSFVVPTGHTTVNYSVTTTNSGSTDRVYQLFTACGGTSLFCFDPESGSFTGLTAGNTYVLRTHTYSNIASTVSNFDLCLSVPPPTPANDECAAAIAFPVIPLNGNCATVTVNTASATQSLAACTGTGANDDVWFSFVVPTGHTTINYGVTTTNSGSADRVFQLFTACGGTSLYCSDNESGSFTGLTAGNTYILRTHTYSSTASIVSNFDLCLSVPPPPPANDACANAINLPCGTNGLAGTTAGTITEVPSAGCSQSSFGVWYTFVGNGYSTTVSSVGNFDIEMAIASGACGVLANVVCVDDELSGVAETYTFTTVAGTIYNVYISHWLAGSTTTGTFTISRSCAVNEWTGNALNTDWATNGNWSTGTAPTSAGIAYIPTSPAGANFPIIDEAAAIATITLASGSNLSIISGHSLSVTGFLINNGTVNVASGGSLVQGAASVIAGSGIYNVSRTGSAVYDFWSSPITLAPTAVLYGGSVYAYDPELSTASVIDDAFDPGWVPPGATMIPGKGYAAYGNTTETFSGVVNNGNISPTVEYHNNPDPTQGGVPFNLIGNPYPSGVDGALFLSTNNSILSVGSIYLWDDPGTTPYASSDFAVWNTGFQLAGGGNHTPGSTIGSAQGFEVQVSANGIVQFTNAMRVASNTTMLFRQSEEKKLWLSALSTENRYNQTAIGFMEDGTDGPDWSYDAPKINLGSGHSFYSLMDGAPYAIQAYGSLFLDRIVPLGFISAHQSIVTITLDTIVNMENDIIYLEDRYLNVFQDMHEGSYVFQTDATTYNDRFFLHFATPSATAVNEAEASNPMHAFINNGMLTVVKGNVGSAALEIFDMSGRVVYSSNGIEFSNGLTKVDVSRLSMGVYVVRMIANGEMSSQKVIK